MSFEHLCPDCFRESFYSGKCNNCGYIAEERSERCLPLFQVLSERYLIGRVLGIGGFGITYKAYDIYNNVPCAVKEYVPMNISVRMDDRITVVPVDEKHRGYFMHGQERFIEEAIILKRLSSVREIVNITDYFSENNTSYFTMEFLDGENLKSLYRTQNKKGEKIPFEFCCMIIIKIGYALNQIHTQSGIFHRDISPENIFITSTGDIKLIDFGNAKHCTKEESQNFSVVLKQGFAPPEQYSTKGAQGAWTDVYSLACTFYLIVGGQLIAPAPDRLQGVTYKPLYMLNPECPVEISDIVDKSLKLNYRERHQSVMPLVNALERYLSSGSESGQAETPAKAGNERPEITFSEHRADYVFSFNAQKRPYIKVIQGNMYASVWYIPADIELMLGRAQSQCNIVLSEYNHLSGKHCTITYSTARNAFLVKDISTYGTVANGVRLEKDCYYLLYSGSRLVLAESCIIEIGADS